VNNRNQKISNVLELTEIASEIKKHLKTIKGKSKYLINRRTSGKNPSMSRAFTQAKEMANAHGGPGLLPIGQVLLKAKLIDEEQLSEALSEHWSSRELIGQTLIKMNIITKENLAPFLVKYQNS